MSVSSPVSSRSRRRSGRRLGGALAVLAALAGASGALLLALNHPLFPLVALLAGLGAAAAAWRSAALMVGVLVACLPLIGLMPWTGWLVAEELDLLVLAVGAGGYARLAFDRLARSIRPERSPYVGGATALKALAVGLFVGATLYSMTRGFADAGGLAWSWWQGYHEPLNSLRLAKSIVLAAWLLPLMRLAWRRDEEATDQALGMGVAAGCLVVSLVVVWERLANTGLLNFSSDYRTTALFWEMHVGGAALDGFLALTLPFALHQMLVARAQVRWLLAAGVVLLGAYASLVTFSRGVYLAVPVGVALMWLLLMLQQRRTGGFAAQADPGRPWLVGLLLWLAFVAAAAQMFVGSGYRGMLALLGAVTLLLPMAALWRAMPARAWLAGAALAAVLAPLAALGSTMLPKGAYWLYAAAWCAGAATVALAWFGKRAGGASGLGAVAWALYATVAVMLCMVALHWGDDRGLAAAWPVALGLLVVSLAGARRNPLPWPDALRWQGGLLAAMGVSAVALGVFLGGTYMGGRFETVDRDLAGRVDHWQRALSWLRDPVELAFGRGTGRYPASHFHLYPLQERTGDFRWQAGDGGRPGGFLVLTAGQHTQGWGELFRVSQRIGPARGPVRVQFSVRAERATGLHFEICRKTLLYDRGCAVVGVRVPATQGQWMAMQAVLPGEGIGRGGWPAPNLVVFSMAVTDRGGVVALDDLRVTDAGRQELIGNGGFDDGTARWFFTSDRNHMPWHMKNLPLQVLFEQGWVGLGLLAALAAGALWRTALGRARDHPLAPPLAGALAAFAVVGLFDSLLDAPRVAWLFYLLLLLALALPARPGR